MKVIAVTGLASLMAVVSTTSADIIIISDDNTTSQACSVLINVPIPVDTLENATEIPKQIYQPIPERLYGMSILLLWMIAWHFTEEPP